MKSRLARGAVLSVALLAVACAAYFFGVYNSSDAKKARWQKAVEKELQIFGPVIDSLRSIRQACLDSAVRVFDPERRKAIKKALSDVDTSGLNLKEKMNILFDKEKSGELLPHKGVKYCNSLYPPIGTERKYDSLNFYRKQNYDCEKIIRFSINRPERIPSVCR
jgi:hypothetical protein